MVWKSSLKKVISIFLMIVLTTFFLSYFVTRFMFLRPINKEGIVGIIDEDLSMISEKKVQVYCYNKLEPNLENQSTHGDQLMDFVESFSPNINIYYFSAYDPIRGTITEEKILEGLIWMNENDVKNINISLSSKAYSENLETRLSDFENMNIYCSYNNLANSLDYPASYNQVIGVGKINNSNKTTIKRAYSTNKILVINNFESKYFEGNSFLSLLTAIEEL